MGCSCGDGGGIVSMGGISGSGSVCVSWMGDWPFSGLFGIGVGSFVSLGILGKGEATVVVWIVGCRGDWGVS